MNKCFYLIACLPFTLMGMEEYLNDYRTLLTIKKIVAEAATKVKKVDGRSAIALEQWRSLQNNPQQQTRQGFALEWDSNKPKIIWRLGTCEFSGTASIQHNGESIFLSELMELFDAQEIRRKPVLLRTNSDKEIPIGNRQIVTYALRKVNGNVLPEMHLKEVSELIDEATVKLNFKKLETH